MNKMQEQERLKGLFQELERLALTPAVASALDIQQELNRLRERLLELESQMLDDTENAVGQGDGETRNLSSGLALYDKDRIGYVYSSGATAALLDEKYTSSGNENTASLPLYVGGQIIGDVEIEPKLDRQLTTDQILMTEAIAQQVSLQIQSLRLLSEADRSRAEAEAATRRFVHEGWDSYLDAVQRDERIGYTYDQSSVSSFNDILHVNGGIQSPVKVTDETIGVMYIEPGPRRPLQDTDKDLIQAVANQVAQQVENIRLLADASRARAESEDAIRRLAHDNWQKFTTDRTDLGFVYDTLQVNTMEESDSQEELNLVSPLVVQGETIGQIGITRTRSISLQDTQLANSIAAQVSVHLETLRLNEELVKRAEELQELDRLKSAFLANMSHELRTPLNSILGFTDVMLEGLDGDLTDYMDNDLRLIQKNGQHLLHLINDVLDMAKIESGRMNLHPQKFVLHELLDEITSITSTLASEKNTALFIDEDSEKGVEIFADETRLRQVMINLVNNAIKFTVNGKISLRASMLDSARVLISVKDTGLGIPPEKLESIFEEFSQVDTSTTRKVGGTGLGLPISRRLVEMHGGRLWAESVGVEGEGSTFHVELPIEARISEVVEKLEK